MEGNSCLPLPHQALVGATKGGLSNHGHSLKPLPPLLGQGSQPQVPTHHSDVCASLLPWDGHGAEGAALLPNCSLVVCMQRQPGVFQPGLTGGKGEQDLAAGIGCWGRHLCPGR